MSANTGISWTDRTWNPVVGCTKVSQGCKHCYAKTLHDMRHKAFAEGKLQNIPQYAQPFETVQTLPDRLNDPYRWRKPSRVFVNSMSDLFHDDVPGEFIAQVFAVMSGNPQHTFQVLTKRPARMLAFVAAVGLSPLGFRRTAATASSSARTGRSRTSGSA
jgi:protein gp37